MSGPAYLAARAVAPTVEAYFARQHSAAREPSEIGPLPSAPVVETIVNTAFWASLRHEEGRSPKISLAYLPPDRARQPLTFERRLPLTAETLTRLAPAVERPGIHLGVWHHGDDLYVWGAARTVPPLCFVLEVIEPGLLVIKYSRGEAFGKFGNVAVLQGEEIKVVDENIARNPDCPDLLASLVGQEPPATWLEASNVFVQLAVSMRAHAHGGSLLVVPSGSRRWQESIMRPISYRVDPAFTRLSDAARRDASERNSNAGQQDIRTAIDGIAGLTAVDGATIMNDRYELLAFGAKIKLSDTNGPVEQVLVKEPAIGHTDVLADIAWIGGTRHLSAAQFVHDQRDALALVASQDGRFTIFAWSALDEIVHANRVDSLLL